MTSYTSCTAYIIPQPTPPKQTKQTKQQKINNTFTAENIIVPAQGQQYILEVVAQAANVNSLRAATSKWFGLGQSLVAMTEGRKTTANKQTDKTTKNK